MGKDFLRWHAKKILINNYNPPHFFKEREVWFCRLGINIGYEEDGSGVEFLRPVVIMRRMTRKTCFIIPLTRTSRQGRYYVALGNDGRSFAMLAQARVIDARRLHYRSHIVSANDFKKLRKGLLAVL